MKEMNEVAVWQASILPSLKLETVADCTVRCWMKKEQTERVNVARGHFNKIMNLVFSPSMGDLTFGIVLRFPIWPYVYIYKANCCISTSPPLFEYPILPSSRGVISFFSLSFFFSFFFFLFPYHITFSLIEFGFAAYVTSILIVSFR